jgi:hypothetical protein
LRWELIAKKQEVYVCSACHRCFRAKEGQDRDAVLCDSCEIGVKKMGREAWVDELEQAEMETREP